MVIKPYSLGRKFYKANYRIGHRYDVTQTLNCNIAIIITQSRDRQKQLEGFNNTLIQHCDALTRALLNKKALQSIVILRPFNYKSKRIISEFISKYKLLINK